VRLRIAAQAAGPAAVKEPATTLGLQTFPITCSPDGKRLAGIAGDWTRAELFGVCAERRATGTMVLRVHGSTHPEGNNGQELPVLRPRQRRPGAVLL